jgi:hypothetical protein
MKTRIAMASLLALAGFVGGCAWAPKPINKKVPPAAPPAAPKMVCAGIVERAEPLEEGNNLIVRARDLIKDLRATTWGESGVGWNRKGDVVRFRVSERQVLAVPLISEGNGAALALLTEHGAGLCVINVWALAFGGNGVDIQTIRVEARSPKEALIRLELVGHHRGYYANPDDEGSYVEPADQPMRAVIGTNGTRAWMADPNHPVGGQTKGAQEAQ